MGALVKHRAVAAPETGVDDIEQRQFLTFQLGAEVFGIGILTIKEIIEYGHLTPVPLAPPYIRGVINLRGAVVPVIDLAVRFGRAPLQAARRTCVIIVEVPNDEGAQVFGAMVDAVNEVLDIPVRSIEAAPSFGVDIRADFIQGMGKLEDRFVVLLDTAKVLSVDELAVAGRLAHAEDGAA